MTEFSGAGDSSDFDCNTILLGCQNNECVYVSGLEILKIKTDDKVTDYILVIGNNMCPSTIAIYKKNTFFISERYKFFENDKIEEGTLLNATKDNLDPFDCQVEKCGIDSSEMLECRQIHTCWPGFEEDEEDEDDVLDDENQDMIETKYCNGNNEMVKIFNQKCVICHNRDSVYAFRQCGNLCIRELCYQNKGDFDILKCVVCGT